MISRRSTTAIANALIPVPEKTQRFYGRPKPDWLGCSLARSPAFSRRLSHRLGLGSIVDGGGEGEEGGKVLSGQSGSGSGAVRGQIGQEARNRYEILLKYKTNI